jgi:sugar phosphate isomerase/epimerase
MKFAVMTFPFEKWREKKGLDHVQVASIIKKCGADGVELFANWFMTPDGQQIDEAALECLKRGLAGAKVKVPAVDIICDLVQPEDATRQKNVRIMENGIRIARELGAGVALVAGHSPKKGLSSHVARGMIAKSMFYAWEFAKDRLGVILAIEDFGLAPELICRAEDCMEVVRLSHYAVRFVLDSGNFAFAGQSLEDAMTAMHPDSICHVHIKDLRKAKKGDSLKDPDRVGDFVCCPMGSGFVPNFKAAQWLIEGGYEGWVSFEPPLGGGDPGEIVGRDLPLVKKMFAA